MTFWLRAQVVLRVSRFVIVPAFGALLLLTSSGKVEGEARSPETTQAESVISPASAQALEAKIQALSDSNPDPPATLSPIIITDVEANSYLKYRGKEFLPAGVYEPKVHVHPDRISGAAEVDFVELNRAGTQPDDWAARLFASMFRGRQRVQASGRLETRNGQGKLTIENVILGTTAVPQVLVNWMIQNYVQARYNLDLSKPFALPDHVTHIELADGRATFRRSPYKAAKSN